MTDIQPTTWRPAIGRLAVGLAILAFGLFLFAETMGWLPPDLHWSWGWWPLILVAIGLGRLLGGRGRRDVQGGLWLIFAGLWLVANFEHLFGLTWQNSWPLMVIAGGAMLVWGAVADPHACKGKEARRAS